MPKSLMSVGEGVLQLAALQFHAQAAQQPRQQQQGGAGAGAGVGAGTDAANKRQRT